MIERQVEIINKLGLHARAAAKLVQLASSFDADIQIQCRRDQNDKTVNGKSIMGVMMLAATQGTSITLIANGTDESAAIDELESLIKQGFGEDL